MGRLQPKIFVDLKHGSAIKFHIKKTQDFLFLNYKRKTQRKRI